MLGPESAVSAKVVDQLGKLGTTTRISGDTPQKSSVAFARFSDGAFGWGVTDPGHGLVFANPAQPATAGAAAPLSAAGSYGPLLLVNDDGSLPDEVVQFLLDIQPGYDTDPVRGVYNHGWLVGDERLISLDAQSRIDALLEISPRERRIPVSQSEHPDRVDPAHQVTVEDVRQLMGASTPHFALQLRNRIANLIAPLPADHPARLEGEREIQRLVRAGLLGRDARHPRPAGPADAEVQLARRRARRRADRAVAPGACASASSSATGPGSSRPSRSSWPSLADERGLDSVWIAEAWGQDAVSVLGLLAGKTSRVGLGSGLMQIPARKPTATAMAAASLDVISGGRFRLGLGLSGPQVSEGWYGVPFGEGLRRTREYVDVVRRALDRQRIQAPMEAGGGPRGLGKPLKLLTKPVQDHLPIYLGATGPKSIALTAEIADGWLPFVIEKAMLGEDRPRRATAPFDIAAAVPVAVGEDLAAMRDAVRPWLAFYFGAMGAPQKNFYVELAERHGHGDAARTAQARWLERDLPGAAAALTDELVDAAALACRPGDLAGRLDEYAQAGATTLIALPCGDRRATVEALADVRAAA